MDTKHTGSHDFHNAHTPVQKGDQSAWQAARGMTETKNSSFTLKGSIHLQPALKKQLGLILAGVKKETVYKE